MDICAIMEELSRSYLLSVTAMSGIDFEIIEHDKDSTDIWLKKTINLSETDKFLSELRVQLKSTASPSQYTEDANTVTYKLKAKNYNDLYIRGTSQAILCLLILPFDKSEWLKWSPKELIMNGRMYWRSLYGEKSTKNKDSISIKIDKNNKINPEKVDELLLKIAKEESL